MQVQRVVRLPHSFSLYLGKVLNVLPMGSMASSYLHKTAEELSILNCPSCVMDSCHIQDRLLPHAKHLLKRNE